MRPPNHRARDQLPRRHPQPRSRCRGNRFWGMIKWQSNLSQSEHGLLFDPAGRGGEVRKSGGRVGHGRGMVPVQG